jgi:hypothetical protein
MSHSRRGNRSSGPDSLSDYLIALAGYADHGGLSMAAESLVELAYRVLDDKEIASAYWAGALAKAVDCSTNQPGAPSTTQLL